MGSWHDQWRDAWSEVGSLDDGAYKDALRSYLSRAREHIRDENTPAERRVGGLMVADVRSAILDLKDSRAYMCVVDESAGMKDAS